ncbi:MAG: prenyltransferase/squalene oxidase repeat-containing protein [Planctomycetota bacterium]
MTLRSEHPPTAAPPAPGPDTPVAPGNAAGSPVTAAPADLADLSTTALASARRLLLDRRNAFGCWTGRLSTSALSTATAVMAQLLASLHTSSHTDQARLQQRITGGLDWLARHRNPDGGWGDTQKSFSNISTTMLAHATFHAVSSQAPHLFKPPWQQVLADAGHFIQQAGGVDAVVRRYGRDRTFSVPILTHCALAGTVAWDRVIPLPFELACVPQRWYAAIRLPVVSYALPALIAIGQAVFKHRKSRNPFTAIIRRAAIPRSLKILESIQPVNGGFLEAAPLTSFVAMSLISCGLLQHPVAQRCLQFLENSVLDDGSWPIDTNLATWLTTLSINALAASPSGLPPELNRTAVRTWLLNQQYRTEHPYTQAAPGGWSWTDLPGGVPDADDTPGAMLAILNLRKPGEDYSPAEHQALQAAGEWLLGLQNRDGGWPTFCRGWGALPFDRSSSDLTAHVLRAFQLWQDRLGFPSPAFPVAMQRGLQYLRNQQRPDGTWLPLWFGNQHHPNDENPLYGTTRVLRALTVTGQSHSPAALRATQWLLNSQHADGSWSGSQGLPASIEETALALEALADVLASPPATSPLTPEHADTLQRVPQAADRGAQWLLDQVKSCTLDTPSPIGFYFAKLWYFESLYPIIFAVSGLNRWDAVRNRTASATLPDVR